MALLDALAGRVPPKCRPLAAERVDPGLCPPIPAVEWRKCEHWAIDAGDGARRGRSPVLQFGGFGARLRRTDLESHA